MLAALLLLLGPQGAVVHADLAFGPDPKQMLDLYVPEAVASAWEDSRKRPFLQRPVVVLVHGGGWVGGDKANRSLVGEKPRWAARKGWLLASVNYRLEAPYHPQQVQDLAAAVAWLSRNVSSYGGDPSRFVLLGHSAGAHLVTLLASDPRWLGEHGLGLDRIRGVVSLDTARYAEGPSVILDDRLRADAAPMSHLASGLGIPPMLLYHTGRRRAAREGAQAMEAALRDAGVPARARHAPDRDHAGINRRFGAEGDRYGEETAAFFDACLCRPSEIVGGTGLLPVFDEDGDGGIEVGWLLDLPPSFEFDSVFGMPVYYHDQVPASKIAHVRKVFQDWLDADEDGAVDDPFVLNRLLADRASLVVLAGSSEQDEAEFLPGLEEIEEFGFQPTALLFESEIRPDGGPHAVDAQGGRLAAPFDASLEEIWHLVGHGWSLVYPEAFGTQAERPSALTRAMDLARGGRFLRIPGRYPDRAWYRYRDPTCEYRCQVDEYFYWTLTSLLGGQDYPGRADQIVDEWSLSTPASLRQGDPAAYALLTDRRYRLPRRLPDGQRPDGE